MLPDSTQPQPAQSQATLPAMPPQPQAVNPALIPVAPVGSKDQAVVHAKSLVTQYVNDPFMLAKELERLKSGYINEQFHVAVNPTEN